MFSVISTTLPLFPEEREMFDDVNLECEVSHSAFPSDCRQLPKVVPDLTSPRAHFNHKKRTKM